MTNPVSNLLGIRPAPATMTQEALDSLLLDVRLPAEHNLHTVLTTLKDRLRIMVSEDRIELADGERGNRLYTHISTLLGPRALLYLPKEIPIELLKEPDPPDTASHDSQSQHETTGAPRFGASITGLGLGFKEKADRVVILREGLNVLMWSYLHTITVRWPKYHQVKAKVVPWNYVAQLPTMDEATQVNMVKWILDLPGFVDPELTEEELRRIARIIAAQYRDRDGVAWRGKLGLAISDQFANNFQVNELDRSTEEVSLQVVKRLVRQVSLPSVYSLDNEPPLAKWLRHNLDTEVIPPGDKEFLEGIAHMYKPTAPSP
jgi:hypothetical protein